jgi:hypothetical protein
MEIFSRVQFFTGMMVAVVARGHVRDGDAAGGRHGAEGRVGRRKARHRGLHEVDAGGGGGGAEHAVVRERGAVVEAEASGGRGRGAAAPLAAPGGGHQETRVHAAD